MYISAPVSTWYSWRLREAVGSPGTRVTGACEPPMGLPRIEPSSPGGAASALNRWVVSLAQRWHFICAIKWVLGAKGCSFKTTAFLFFGHYGEFQTATRCAIPMPPQEPFQQKKGWLQRAARAPPEKALVCSKSLPGEHAGHTLTPPWSTCSHQKEVVLKLKGSGKGCTSGIKYWVIVW